MRSSKIPSSLTRRKVEKYIGLAFYKVVSRFRAPRFRRQIRSFRLKEATSGEISQNFNAPQGLLEFNTRIGVYCEDTCLQSTILQLFPNSKVLEANEFLTFKASEYHGLSSFLFIVTTRLNFDEINSFFSNCVASNFAAAVYLLDKGKNQLFPLLGNTVSEAIPLGIFPFKHNPQQKFVRKGNAWEASILCNFFRLIIRLRGLRPTLTTKKSYSSRLFKSELRQHQIAPMSSVRKWDDKFIGSYLARGIQLRTSYSYDLFNTHPIIDYYVEGVHPHRDSQFSWLWNNCLAEAAVSKVYENGTIYDGLAHIFSVLTAQSTLRHPWKSRILIICDDSSHDFYNKVACQSNVDAYLCTTKQATALGGETIRKKFDYITRMSSELVYPPNYLQSKLTAFRYSTADFVSEPERVEQPPHSPIKSANQPFRTVSSTRTKNCLEFFSLRSSQLSGNGLTDSGYGVEYFSRLKNALDADHRPDLKLSVIIPIFNNGEYLVGKALPSLFRNDSWTSMEIILVDDGSTDPNTIAICDFLEMLFPNFRLFKFPEGGSGSASRARNKGIQLATCNALSFLDPDNEISDRGYDKLLKLFTKSNRGKRTCDFVSGFQVKIASTVSVNARHSFSPWPTKIKAPRQEFFESGMFPTISTQAAIINRELLIDKKIGFVPNAVGQDTLFGWEVLLAAKNPIFTNAAYLLYYSERKHSVTNKIDAYYFEKCLRRETAQVKWLRDNALLETYTVHKLRYFVDRWYKTKLSQVPNDQLQDAEEYLNQIVLLYEPQ